MHRRNEMSILSRLKELAHRHKFKTLMIYPPHNQVCDKEQCRVSGDYGFMLRCDCGYTKLTKLPMGIEELFMVKTVVKGAVNKSMKSEELTEEK